MVTGQKLTILVEKDGIVRTVVLRTEEVPLTDQRDVVIGGHETVMGFCSVRGGQWMVQGGKQAAAGLALDQKSGPG
jgi:hypothetical protein